MKAFAIASLTVILSAVPVQGQNLYRQSNPSAPNFRYSRTPNTLSQLENSETRIRTFGGGQGSSSSLGTLNGESFRSRSYRSPYGRSSTNGTISGQRFSCQSTRVFYGTTSSRCR